MKCTCCGVDKELYSFYKTHNGYRKKCQQCTKEQINNRYHTDEEHRASKIEYARFMNPFRDRGIA
jgi:uncharacterized metal-binding protein